MKHVDAPRKNLPIGTLVRGYIRLWDRPVNLHRNYVDCFRSDGVENLIISPNLYGKKRAPVGYAGDVVTSHAFETDLARRFLPDFIVAIRRFLANYAIVTLEEIPLLEEVSGYFVMPAPGRIAYKESPEPIAMAMMRRHETELRVPVSKAQINRALAVGVRKIDRYLRQLLAMNRVAKQGEPEIALIGCAAAIEWYMNSLLPPAKRQLTIPDCLGKTPFRVLPKPFKKHLGRIAKMRNNVVHGNPPERLSTSRELITLRSRIAGVAEAVEIGLRLYREMNLKKMTIASVPTSM